MNLTLRILWFDDNEEYFHSLPRGPFEEVVRSWGFIPSIELVTSPEAFMNRAPFRDYDLIVVDYNLGGDAPHGEEFIRQIRAHNVYTEVIFYSTSATSTLWEAIQENQLEGVYVSDRPGILLKLERVAEQSVHKMLDINNMRGIVMAEVGDIDLLIEEIVSQGASDLSAAQKAKVFEEFHEQASDHASSTMKKLEKFKGNPSVKAMLDLSDSYKRWRNFLRIKKRHSSVKQHEVGDYSKDILTPRNFLAHGIPKATGDGYIFEFQGTSYPFSREIGLKLRMTILDYRKKFQAIRTQLAKKGA
jgi:hypothetical protein